MDDLPTALPYALAILVLGTAGFVIIQGYCHIREERRLLNSPENVATRASRQVPAGTRLHSKGAKTGVQAANATEASILRDLEQLESELSLIEGELGIDKESETANQQTAMGAQQAPQTWTQTEIAAQTHVDEVPSKLDRDQEDQRAIAEVIAKQLRRRQRSRH